MRRRPGYGRRLRPGHEPHLAGVRALADGDCSRCSEPILKEQRIVPAGHGRWMHTTCASGADDGALTSRAALQVLVVTLPLIVAALLAIHLGHSPPI